MLDSAFCMSPWRTPSNLGAETRAAHAQWEFRHDPMDPASLEYSHHRHPHRYRRRRHWSSDPAIDFDDRADSGGEEPSVPMDPTTTPSHHRSRTGRWVRTGNTITLLNVTGTASGTADTEPNDFQLEERLNELEVPRLGVAIPGTTHRLDCPGGCAPIPAARCIAVLRQAISEAINMALGAANKLHDTLKPGSRTPDASKTAHFFQSFFGHDPTRAVEWDAGRPSGASIAYRYRSVASELGGGRQIVFRCGDAALCAGAVAVTRHCTPGNIGIVELNVINLCPPFWAPPALPGLPPENFRGATILHEMLHILFCEGFHDGGLPPNQFRRNNASCLEAFACRVNDFGADPTAVALCVSRPV
jgi:hypothetical protein